MCVKGGGHKKNVNNFYENYFSFLCYHSLEQLLAGFCACVSTKRLDVPKTIIVILFRMAKRSQLELDFFLVLFTRSSSSTAKEN